MQKCEGPKCKTHQAGQIKKQKASFNNEAVVRNPKEHKSGAQSNNYITYDDLKINVMAQALLDDRSTKL